MDYELKETEKGNISVVSIPSSQTLNSCSEFFDLIMNSPSNTTAVQKTSITDSFFDLRSGMAGEVLQKVSNYRKRLIVLGDFGMVESKSLIDFIRESNRTGKVIFCESLDRAIELLR